MTPIASICKRKIAKIRPAQPMRVAQQPHFGFGFFGSNTW